MEEFLLVLHYLRAREFNFNVAHERNTPIHLDRCVIVDSF